MSVIERVPPVARVYDLGPKQRRECKLCKRFMTHALKREVPGRVVWICAERAHPR